MRRPERTGGSGSGAPRPARKGLGSLAITSIVVAVVVAGVIGWAQWSGPPTSANKGPAVQLALAPPPERTPRQEAQAAATSPEAPAPAPPAKPANTPEAAPPEAPPETGMASSPAVEPPKPQEPEAPAAVPEPPAETAPPAPAAAPAPQTPTSPVKSAALPATVGGGLRPAPDPALVEKTRLGPLPRVAPDGRKPWQAYARPFDSADRRPRIAIIVSGLGLSGAATEAAIQRLPGPITLSFAPYSKGLPQWIALARAAGHEVLLDLPMEPVNFPANDPGPHTLLTSLTADQNRERLHWLLGRVTGYVGVVNRMGSRFTTSATHIRPVLKELEQRGLLFVDSRSSLRSIAAQMAREVGLPRAVNNRFIDGEASRDAIDSRLREIERIAKASGYAVGIGAPFPVTIDRLVRWARELNRKNLALAPVSALVNSQEN